MARTRKRAQTNDIREKGEAGMVECEPGELRGESRIGSGIWDRVDYSSPGMDDLGLEFAQRKSA